jgi:photosystem II stability/assembly factor-like uncharacterized protein
MKKILFTVFLILGCISVYSQTWNTVLEPDIKYGINALYFFSADEGFFVGDSSLVLYTNDGGKTLVKKNFPVVRSLRSLFFKDRQHGWVGSIEGYVYRTTDGGETWSEFNLGSLIYPPIGFGIFDAVYFTNNMNGFALGGKLRSDYLFQTNDGGNTWYIKDSMVSATLAQRWYSVDFYDENKGVIVGDKKTIEKYTTDGGQTWKAATTVNDAFFNLLRSVKWINSTTAIAMGEGNEFNGLPTPIYKTTDGGINWVKKPQSVTSYDRVRDIYFKNEMEAIAVGGNGFSKMFYTKTTDGGDTWTPSSANFCGGLTAVSGSGNVLYALGTSSHIFKSTDFGDTWNLLNYKFPTTFAYMQFIGNKAYALSNIGDFYINEDGIGNQWKFLTTTGINLPGAMTFTDENTGFILKDNNLVIKTTDGGHNWRTVLPPSAFNARSLSGGMCFPTKNTGYIWFSLNDYASHYVYKTIDAGESWVSVCQLNGPSTSISGNIAFYDENTGVIAGPSKMILRTTNGGVNWDSVQIKGIPAEIKGGGSTDICIVDANNAWITSDYYFLKSTDKGATWNYVNHGLKGIDSAFARVNFKDVNNGYISSLGYTKGSVLYKTTNAGSSWLVDSTLIPKGYVYSIAYNKNGNTFFGLVSGYITTDMIPFGVKDDAGQTVKSFALNQNYPNPFNPETNISFSLKNGSRVSLKVFDLMGREVATLIDGEKQAGNYNIRFDARNSSGEKLSSGVYFYRLKTNGFYETKKMILVR